MNDIEIVQTLRNNVNIITLGESVEDGEPENVVLKSLKRHLTQAADTIESLQACLTESQRRERAAVECMERALYTATTNHYDVDLCCMYCKYGPEGTCEGESTVLSGNPIDGQEYDWGCRRCIGVSANERGGWEFDYDRWRGPQEETP